MTTPPTDPPSLATLDLSGGEETPVAMAGRIIGGVVLMILGAVVGLAFLAGYLLGWLWDPIADWVELLGDFLLIPATLGLGMAITGFYLVRRGRKARAQEAAEAADYMKQAQQLAAEQAAKPPASDDGIETHL
jgi:hypothetical protein